MLSSNSQNDTRISQLLNHQQTGAATTTAAATAAAVAAAAVTTADESSPNILITSYLLVPMIGSNQVHKKCNLTESSCGQLFSLTFPRGMFGAQWLIYINSISEIFCPA